MGKKQGKRFTPSEWSVFCDSYNGHFSHVSRIVRLVLILLLAILLESVNKSFVFKVPITADFESAAFFIS